MIQAIVCDELVLCSDLDIVSWLGLAVVHGILLHPQMNVASLSVLL